MLVVFQVQMHKMGYLKYLCLRLKFKITNKNYISFYKIKKKHFCKEKNKKHNL